MRSCLPICLFLYALCCAALQANGYPGLPRFNMLGSQGGTNPERQELLRAVDWAASNASWQLHLEALKRFFTETVQSGGKLQWGRNLDLILEGPNLALALQQMQFIRSVGVNVLDELCSSPEQRNFLLWLMNEHDVLQKFNATLLPQDNAGYALSHWYNIWQATAPEARNPSASLAIACALVFDEPITISPSVLGLSESAGSAESQEGSKPPVEVAALQRFRFFWERFQKGGLRTPIDKMEPWELVWVVDAPVPESELLWAQKYVNYPRRDWGKAYGSIRYRMDRATQGVNPYTAYTLEQIAKEGGTCGDQAYFAAISAKANGIPAMIIGGEGNRGGHAWFGFEVNRGKWDLTVGRYNDSYAAGSTIDPQTRQSIKEHELHQRIDPDYRTEAHARSVAMVCFASVFHEQNQNALASFACEKALVLSPKNLAAWWLRLDLLEASNSEAKAWRDEVAKMRTLFRSFADVVQQINERESKYVMSRSGLAEAQKLLNQQKRKLGRTERDDLFVETLNKQVQLAMEAQKPELAQTLFKDALRRKGPELVNFKTIAQLYYEWGKQRSMGPETVRDLIGFFDRAQVLSHEDVFAMESYLEALSMLASFCGEQGLDTQARSLERRESKLKKEIERLSKALSTNAGR